MSTDTPDADDPDADGATGATSGNGDGADADVAPDDLAALQARVEALENERAATDDHEEPKRVTIIATKGTLDMAYPPLILASTAAAFGWDVTVFHTFWGLDILHEEKGRALKLSSVGNPNMPVPNALAALPGMDRMTTKMMEKRIADNNTATIEELVDVCLETGVELQACQMTIDLMDYDEDDFYDGVTTGVGAATALQQMADADIQLLV